MLNFPVLYKELDPRANAIVSQAVQLAIADATTLWAPEKFDGVYPVSGIGIKKLEKWDLDDTGGTHGHPYTNTWLISITTARTWTGIFSNTITDECYIIITGCFNYDSSPDIEMLKITADGIEYPVYELEEMYGWDVATAYFSHPIVVRPSKKIIVEMKALTAGQKRFGFLGYTLGKRSRLLSKMS